MEQQKNSRSKGKVQVDQDIIESPNTEAKPVIVYMDKGAENVKLPSDLGKAKSVRVYSSGLIAMEF
jgi:hypothetical protein